MNRMLKKFGLLVFVFFLAGGAFLFYNHKEQEEAVYVAMEQATLPVISLMAGEERINTLHGYVGDMALTAVRDVTTPLKMDRHLPIVIQNYGEEVIGISYEIRSLDGSQLIERTSLEEEVKEQDGEIFAELKIQNLIFPDTEYSLKIILNTASHDAVYYYSRIYMAETSYFVEMLDFARDFSGKTFDKETAEELVTYLEPSSGRDNSSLADVDIKSSFANITWGDLDVYQEGIAEIRVSELTGQLASIRLVYMVYTEEAGLGRDYYQVTEDFSLKWTNQRIYLMAYERSMNQIFEAGKERISGKKINLGIVSEANIETALSPDGNFTAFVSGQALWSYDLKENKATRIFTFADGTDDKRSSFSQYGIKIISIDDFGNMDFMVYGYMNRDRHEGETGIAYYRYDVKENILEEGFFIPSDKSYQMIRDDIRKLTYVNQNRMCYFLFGSAVYAVDLTGREYMVIAQDLDPDDFIASEDNVRIAWNEGGYISIMNLEDGSRQTITGGAGETLKLLGFVDDDFIYGVVKAEDASRSNSHPLMSTVEIISDGGIVQKRYEQPGIYVTAVIIQDTRIRLERASLTSSGEVTAVSEDTIIRNVEVGSNDKPGLQTERSGSKKLIHAILLKEAVASDKELSVHAPEQILRLEDDLRINLMAAEPGDAVFYSYSFGSLNGIYSSLYDAVESVYDSMGTVTDSGQNILWWRSKKAVGRTLAVPLAFTYSSGGFFREQVEAAYPNQRVLDGSGLTLNQILAFTSDGHLAAGYGGSSEILLIYGYDQYNIMYVDITTGQTKKMGLNDSHALFETYGNQFMVILQ